MNTVIITIVTSASFVTVGIVPSQVAGHVGVLLMLDCNRQFAVRVRVTCRLCKKYISLKHEFIFY